MLMKVQMTLEIGSNKYFLQFKNSPYSAFTLIEIVLVLALITLISSVFIISPINIANQNSSMSPKEILAESIKIARLESAKNRTITDLSYDERNGNLIISENSKILHTLPLEKEHLEAGTKLIDFYLIPPVNGFESFENQKNESLHLENISFSPDRSSTPFFIIIDNGIDPEEKIFFDPFSHYPRKLDL